MRSVVLVSAADDPFRHLPAAARVWEDVDLVPVWAGDPQLRPPGRWADAAWPTIDGLRPGVVRAALSPALRRLVLGLQAVASGGCPGLVIDADRVLLRRCPDIPARAVGVIARGAPPLDGLAPTIADLARWGPYSSAAVSAPPDIAAELVTRLMDAADADRPGAALAASLTGFEIHPLAGEVLGWPVAGDDSTAEGTAVLDAGHVDAAEPWRLDFDSPLPARVRLSDRSALLGRLPGAPRDRDLRAPGGVEIDDAVRRLLVRQIRAARRDPAVAPPDPWEQPAAFVAWLESPGRPWEPEVGRYWFELWLRRSDLQRAFPDPGGDDLVRFRQWADRRHDHEGTSPLLRSAIPLAGAAWRSDGCRPGGIDVVGFFGSEMSLSNVADRMVASLEAIGIPHRTATLHRTGSPGRTWRTDDALVHDTVVVVANHDQVQPMLLEHDEVLAGRRLVGYWHWDVEHVPDDVASRMRHFDEIWVLNEYTERTLASVPGAPPVRSLPLPVPEPVVSAATREDLGLPVGRPVVLVTFDHLSVTERKNPLGAIEAFRRAFPEPSERGPVLVIKTMNADQRWIEHERVRCAAADRPDITVVDRLLSKADQMALVAHADVVLSLHRAEGLGLHLIEAMWLGTPTVATRYSGNLSFMDDENSLLVDASMVPVERGEGFFPAEARWADPDLDQAAGHLRRLLADPGLAARLAAAGRHRMEQQPSFEEIGRTIAAWCGIEQR